MKKKRVLITGISGFLGKSLGIFLSGNNFQVFGCDLKGNSLDENMIVCDLSSKDEIGKFLFDVKPDYIFHLAGTRGKDQTQEALESNFSITKDFFEIIFSIVDYNPRIIIPGSAAEYGDSVSAKGKINEETAALPNSEYGSVKLRQTNLGLLYATKGMDIVIARIFNVLGNGTPSDLSVGRFAQQIVDLERNEGKRVINTYSLSSTRDFLDIEDVCSALLNLAEEGKTGQVYNVCSGNGLSIRDILVRMLKISKVKDISINEQVNCKGSIQKSIGDNAKIINNTGWKPKINIEKSLKNTIKYYRSLK